METGQADNEVEKRYLGSDHPNALNSQDWIGISLADMGNFRAAESTFRNVLESWKRVCGFDSDETLNIEAKLALCLDALGRHKEARSIRERILESRAR